MRPLHRARVAMILAVALTCVFLVQCGDDVTAPDHSTEVNEDIEALAHLDQREAFEERPVGDPVAATYEVNGRTYECTEQTYEVVAEYDEPIVLDPTSDVLWPGAILDGGTIDTGGYVPILAPRTPVTISVSLVNIAGDKSRTGAG